MQSDNKRADLGRWMVAARIRSAGLFTAGFFTTGLMTMGCASPPPEAPEDWRGQLDDMASSTVNASMSVARRSGPEAGTESGSKSGPEEAQRPSYLEGPLLARSELEYVMRRSAEGKDPEHWLLKLRSPEMPTKPRGGWTSMTTRPDAPPERFVHRRAKPYRGTFSIYEKGEETAKNGLVLPLAFFGTPLFEACELAQTTSQEELTASGRTGEEDDPLAAARAAFTAMALAAGRNPAVETILKEAVTWPEGGFFSKPDLVFGLEPDLFAARPVSTQFGPGYRIPVEFQINGDPAFFGSFTVVEPRGALLLTAGVVEVVGFAPHRPEHRVHIALAGGAMPKTGRLDKGRIEKLLAIEPELRIETATIGAPSID